MADFQCQVFNTKPQMAAFQAFRQVAEHLLVNGASVADVVAALGALHVHWSHVVTESQFNPKLVQPAPPGMNGAGPRIAEP